MTYTKATDKPERNLVSYQSVRGAELRAVYRRINSIGGTIPKQQVISDFTKPSEDPNSKPLEYTINLLRALDFVDRPTTKTVEPIDDQPFEELSFELRALHHIRQQGGPQEHFTRIHDVLVGMDRQIVDKTALEEELERELDDFPFDWNVEKVQTWYNLVGPLGLVSVRDNQEILTSPSPAVLYDLLDAYRTRENSTRLAPALEWVEEQFFDCFVSRAGTSQVHAGLSDTFGTLLEDGVLKLRAPSDATREVAVPAAQANAVSAFELSDRPAGPSYQYPLDAFDVEVTA